MKPYWPRTLQLHPAHLQTRDGYLEELLTLRTGRCVPSAYGIVDLELDEAAGTKGEVVVRRLGAILRSGLVVEVGPEDSLRRAFPAGSGSAACDVYVGVPRPVLRGPNVSRKADPARSTRYLAADEDHQGLPWMHAKPEILFGDEPREGFEVLRLGRAQAFGGKSVRFERDALPTMLRLRGSMVLEQGLRQLLSGFEVRLREFVRYRVDHPLALGSVVAEDLPGLQLWVILQRYLPLLADLAARRAAHPHELYEVLVAVHGALQIFADAIEIPPVYAHEDQGQVFPWLFQRIGKLVDEAARSQTTILPFQRTDQTTFRLTFDRTALVGKRPLLVLSGAEDEFLRERVPNLLKMASPTAIAPLLGSAVRGVSVAVEFEPPPVVPRRRGALAYRIDVRDRLWLDIEDRMQIQLSLLGAPASLEAFLYCVERLV